MTIINEEIVNRGNAQKVKPWDYGVAKHACLDVRAAAADTGYVLIDLSNITDYPHRNAAAIILNALHVEAEVLASGVYDILVGVITEVDATNGSVNWVARFQMETSVGGVISLDKFWRAGLNLRIDDEDTPFVITNLTDAGQTTWQSDTALTSPDGTVAPAAGDVVVKIDEISGSGTINMFIEAEYDAI